MDFSSYILYFFQILPIIFFGIFYRRNNDRISKIIFFYILYSILNEVGRTFTVSLNPIPNSQIVDSIFLSSFTIIEYLFLSLFFFNVLNQKKFRIFLSVASIVFILIAAVNFIQLTSNSSSSIDAIPISVGSIILIVASIFYFFESIQNPEVMFVYSKKSFWIVVGIMLYFSGTFFLFLQYDNLSEPDQNNYWIISIICFVLKNIFFSISFILKPENQQVLNADEYYLNKLE